MNANHVVYGRLVRNVENGIPQLPFNLEKAVANLAQAAMNSPEGPAKRFWTNRLWETRNKHRYVSQTATFNPEMTER